MSKIIAGRMIVGDDELHFRDDDAQKKLEDLIVQEKGNSKTAVMSQAAATEEFDKLSEEIGVVKEELGDFTTVTDGNILDLGTAEGECFYNDTNGEREYNSFMFSFKDIPIKNGQSKIFAYSNVSTGYNLPRSVCFYDDNGFISGVYPQPIDTILIPNGATRLNCSFLYENRTGLEKPTIYWLGYTENGENRKEIKSDVRIHYKNIINNPADSVYRGSRRPIITFIFDGDYDLNSEVESMAYKHGYRVGFAPKYKVPFENFPVSKYLEWERNGHEILTHLFWNLYTNQEGTDEENHARIKESYVIMKSYGFDIKGCVGSQGEVDDKYIPTIKKYYDYGFTKNNHAGSYEDGFANAVQYFTNNPIRLWRYSLQLSTLQQCKDAVDNAIETNGLLCFYGHAQSTNDDNFTMYGFNELLSYIDSKGYDVQVLPPYEAIKEYYSIRYDDFFSN